MPIVTDIQKQKRRETRYSIYLDGEYSFSLADLDLSSSGLRVGQEVSPALVEDLQRESMDGKAYYVALRYISYRPRSRREVSDYLARKEYEREVVQRVIVRLERTGLVDDRVFAASWVANRQALKPRSRRQLEQELSLKGIARDVIADVVAELGADGQEQMLVDLIEKKRQLVRFQDSDKLMAYLGRQGFSYDQIKKALVRLDD